MATTVSSFSAIDDTEVDAESPITESLMTRLRDNSYWIDPASTRTSATSNTLVLTPNHTAGTTQWQEIRNIGGVDGTKGNATSITTAWVTITTKTKGILHLHYYLTDTSALDGSVKIDLSDDTYVASYAGQPGSAIINARTQSGTITTGSTYGEYFDGASPRNIQLRRNSGNLQFTSPAVTPVTYTHSWVIL